MENRYKFRVFDTVLKQMSYGFAKHICAEDGTEFVTFGFSFTDGMNTKVITLWEVLNDKRYVVMQCTSQTDKNKKPIYEGDILKDRQGKLYLCVWQTFGFEFEPIGHKNEYLPIYENNVLLAEIIGNKFEHPHLLKGGE